MTREVMRRRADRAAGTTARRSHAAARYGYTRTTINLDVYNLFNSNTTEVFQRTYGATYLNPLSIMSARFFKISAQFDF